MSVTKIKKSNHYYQKPVAPATNPKIFASIPKLICQ